MRTSSESHDRIRAPWPIPLTVGVRRLATRSGAFPIYLFHQHVVLVGAGCHWPDLHGRDFVDGHPIGRVSQPSQQLSRRYRPRMSLLAPS